MAMIVKWLNNVHMQEAITREAKRYQNNLSFAWSEKKIPLENDSGEFFLPLARRWI